MESRTMYSDRTVRYSRAHGARSHSPVAEEGKPLGPQNALRHGLLAEQVVLDNESREAIDDRPTIAANSGNAKRTQSHFRTPYRRRSCRRCSCPQAPRTPPRRYRAVRNEPNPIYEHRTAAGLADGVLVPKHSHA